MSTGKTALTAVWHAVIAVLRADANLTAAVPGGVWDYVPQDPSWPYLCIDAGQEDALDTFGLQGRRVQLQFTVFSTYQGRAEQFAVVDHVVRLLRQVVLSPSGWTHLQTVFVSTSAHSPFDLGDARAGGSTVTLQIDVQETP